jgi:hypothetical protein
MNWISILTMIGSLFATLSSAGPWGIAAMVLGFIGSGGVVAYLIGKWNKSVDAGDIDRSGADAGNTAVDLKNQADANREFERLERERILKEQQGEKDGKN